MTDWDGRWRSQDTPWDKGAPAPPLVELLSTPHAEQIIGQRVLVPGCGSGHDVRELARSGAIATGLDISATAVARAQQIESIQGASFIAGSFFDWESDPFDAIWEHTCFCAIEPDERVRYARACGRLIRPGGYLTGVFYLEPWPPGETPSPPPYRSEKAEIIQLLEPEFVLRWDKIPELSFPGREGREWLAVFQRLDRDRGVADSGMER
ncbi:methyltransferase domain-containing protein [Haloferula sp.]|uniref:methyltransferase domain-containing protein n=1 Tax=Haloferula sp. TaxID=2497595 RepID=UPI003C70DB2A